MRCLRFVGVLEGSEIQMFFGTEQIEVKSDEIGNLRPEGRPIPILGLARVECAEPAEALESVSSRVLIWHASSPERGQRI
jgi:hypothetical protein